jgi:hypothetical protein
MVEPDREDNARRPVAALTAAGCMLLSAAGAPGQQPVPEAPLSRGGSPEPVQRISQLPGSKQSLISVPSSQKHNERPALHRNLAFMKQRPGPLYQGRARPRFCSVHQTRRTRFIFDAANRFCAFGVSHGTSTQIKEIHHYEEEYS